MKKITVVVFLMLNLGLLYGQGCPGEYMSTYIYVDGFPYGGVTTVIESYDDPRVIRWNDAKLSGEPIYLDNFNITDDIPFEISDEVNNIPNLFSK